MTFWPLCDFSALPMSLFGPANMTFFTKLSVDSLHSLRIQIVHAIENRILWRHQSALLSNRWVHSQLGGRALAVTAESNGAGDRKLALVLWVLKGRNGCRVIIRIETGHSNLVSCFGPRIRALGRYFTSAFASVKYLSQRPHPRAKTWHKIWMTGLNPTIDG